MIYSESEVQAQISELESAIALLPKDFSLSRGFLQKQLDTRTEYLRREEEDRRLRLQQAEWAKKPQNVVEIPPETILKSMFHQRSLMLHQRNMSLPFEAAQIQERIDALDIEIRKLEERIKNESAA